MIGYLMNEQVISPTLLEKIQLKDKSTLETIVRKFTKDLLRASLSMGFKNDEAQDLVQNTWTVFLDKCNNFQGKSQIKTYLFGILYNKASELRREIKKLERTDPIDEIVNTRFDQTGEFINSPINPDRFYQISESLTHIHQCLDALPLNQRTAFCLKEVDGLETKEICNILNVSDTHLNVMLFRARNKLRECLESKAKGIK